MIADWRHYYEEWLWIFTCIFCWMCNFGEEYEECCLLISYFHSYALSGNADGILVVKAMIFTSDQYKSNVLHPSPTKN
jgi:hypothetical protein